MAANEPITADVPRRAPRQRQAQDGAGHRRREVAERRRRAGACACEEVLGRQAGERRRVPTWMTAYQRKTITAATITGARPTSTSTIIRRRGEGGSPRCGPGRDVERRPGARSRVDGRGSRRHASLPGQHRLAHADQLHERDARPGRRTRSSRTRCRPDVVAPRPRPSRGGARRGRGAWGRGSAGRPRRSGRSARRRSPRRGVSVVGGQDGEAAGALGDRGVEARPRRCPSSARPRRTRTASGRSPPQKSIRSL